LPDYRLLPLIGIDAVDLARTMLLVGLEGGQQTIFENADIRRYAKAHPRPGPR